MDASSPDMAVAPSTSWAAGPALTPAASPNGNGSACSSRKPSRSRRPGSCARSTCTRPDEGPSSSPPRLLWRCPGNGSPGLGRPTSSPPMNRSRNSPPDSRETAPKTSGPRETGLRRLSRWRKAIEEESMMTATTAMLLMMARTFASVITMAVLCWARVHRIHISLQGDHITGEMKELPLSSLTGKHQGPSLPPTPSLGMNHLTGMNEVMQYTTELYSIPFLHIPKTI